MWLAQLVAVIVRRRRYLVAENIPNRVNSSDNKPNGDEPQNRVIVCVESYTDDCGNSLFNPSNGKLEQ